MKKFLAILFLGSALAAAGPIAHADQIGFVGADSFTSNFITFTNPAFQLGSATGIFAPFAGSSATFTSFNFVTYGAGSPQVIITDTSGSQSFSYTLFVTGYTESLVAAPTTTCPACETLSISGDGSFAFSGPGGPASSLGSFSLTSQGVPGGPGTVNFSETSYGPTVTPEPSSLMLLGTGLVGTAGMFFRRRRTS
jgi:hypothetical protein